MLSRVADSLYWMARYIERAENLARLIDVNLQLLLDYRRLDSEKRHAYWRPVLMSSGEDALFHKLYSDENSSAIAEFLTFNPGTSNCIHGCICQARENARTVRDQISEEMWEEINSLYLFIASAGARQQCESDPYSFYHKIRHASLLFQGITDATIPHNEGWEFIQAGKYLERADKTSRILDIRSYLPGKEENILPGLDSLQRRAVLRSTSAYGAYHTRYRGRVTSDNVADLLIFSREFPRSILFCLRKLDFALHAISGATPGYYANPAEKSSGQALALLSFGSIEDVKQKGLHNYLDELQALLNQIGQEIFETYILMPDAFAQPLPAHQMQQQQQ